MLGVAYGFPDAKGLGGSTTTAELCRKMLFSKSLRGRMVNLCPELYRSAMRMILVNDLVILRLMSCDYVLLPDKIGIRLVSNKFKIIFKHFPAHLCVEQMKLKLTELGGAWVRFPDSIHELYAHLAQFIGKIG